MLEQVKRTLSHESKPVSDGAVITYTIPSFDTIDDIVIAGFNSGAASTKANMIASIGKVALSINGAQIINCPLSELFNTYARLGVRVFQNALTNTVSLNVGRLAFKQLSDFFAWGCKNVNTIQLQVYCTDSVDGVTDLQVYSVRRKVENNLGAVVKIINYPQSFSGTGISTVDTLPRDTNEAYVSITALGGTIASGEAIVNGDNIMNPTPISVNGYVNQSRGFQQLSGEFLYQFSDGTASGALPMVGVTELRLKTEFTVAPTGGTYNLTAVSIRDVPVEMITAINRK